MPPEISTPPGQDSQTPPPQQGGTQSPPAPPSDQKPNGKPPASDGKAASGTLYEDLGEKPPGEAGSHAFPENWRTQMFGEDPKVQEWAKRLTDPASAGKMLLAAQQRIRSGEYKRSAPKSDSPEDMKAWRDENGIPETFEEYPFPMPGDITVDKLDDAGKARVNHFREGFHKLNLPSAQVEAIVGLYNQMAEKDAAATAEADAHLADATEDALRAEWQRDFKANMMANVAYLEKSLGEDMTDALMGARLPDGRRLMNLPEVAKWINGMARASDFNFEAGEGGAVSSIEGRWKDIQKIMQTDYARYQREKLGDEFSRLSAELEKRGKLPTNG